jgi:hypothetical protein
VCRQQEWFVRADMAVGEPVSQGRTALWRGEAEEEDTVATGKTNLTIAAPLKDSNGKNKPKKLLFPFKIATGKTNLKIVVSLN